MSWMRYRKKRDVERNVAPESLCSVWVRQAASGEQRYVIPGGAFHLIPVHRPVETQQAPVLCRFNDWHQFCNTRWSDQFKREIRRIRCTLLIGRKHRLPVISQRREGGKNIAAEFSVSQIYWKKKKLHVLCHTIRDKFWVIGRRVEILTFIQLY